MPDALEEFAREVRERFLKELPLKKRLERLTLTERLQGVSLEDRLEGLSVEERKALLRQLQSKRYGEEGIRETLARLSREIDERLFRDIPIAMRLAGLTPAQRLQGLSPKERLEGLTAEERWALLRLLQAKESSVTPD